MSPVKREGYKFCQDICIPCYQTDANMVLKPAAFMDVAQEIAYWAAQELGFGYDSLHIHHTAWVLSRMHIHFEKLPAWRDNVKLYTWHKGANGLFYLRDFKLLGQDGTPAVTATSSWVVIDEQTRRLVRPEDLAQLLDVEFNVDDAIAEPAPKLSLPKDREAEPVGEHVVSYSDVDLIGHANNACYMVWAMDCLPPEVTLKGQVKDAYINFNKETTPGTPVQLFRLQESQNVWYVEGRVEGKSHFIVRLEL
ncbi:MAG: hypothetical protein J5519_01325 [Bacteroidales bacterium]|nr:hypothetical protein [Bacteroidales bacterium]